MSAFGFMNEAAGQAPFASAHEVLTQMGAAVADELPVRVNSDEDDYTTLHPTENSAISGSSNVDEVLQWFNELGLDNVNIEAVQQLGLEPDLMTPPSEATFPEASHNLPAIYENRAHDAPEQDAATIPEVTGLGDSITFEVTGLQDFCELREPHRTSQWAKPPKIQPKSPPSTSGDLRDLARKGSSRTLGRVLPLRVVEVYMRPDIMWSSILDVLVAVMLAKGLVVKETSSRQVWAERAANAPGNWKSVEMRMGVTATKLRVLAVQFFPDVGAPVVNLAGAGASPGGLVGDDVFHPLKDALLEHRLTLSFLGTCAHSITLDPQYVMDLLAMYSHENTANLTKYALPLEEFIRGEERRSAELVATLLPCYQACGVRPPRPFRAKSLSHYPLELERGAVEDCDLQAAQQLVERVRGDAWLGAPDTANAEDPGRAAAGVSALIRAVWAEITNWCDEEAGARMRRKDLQVRDRLLNVERYREKVVASIRDSGAAGSSPMNKDFNPRFRVMSGDVVLIDCPVAYSKRVGRLYVTSSHLCFHSSLLGFVSQKVIPMITVASMARSKSALGVDTVVLLDRGGEKHTFAITAVESTFVTRFCDLLLQLLHMCKVESRRRAQQEGAMDPSEAAPPDDAAEGAEDELQILERVQREARGKYLQALSRPSALATAISTDPPEQPTPPEEPVRSSPSLPPTELQEGGNEPTAAVFAEVPAVMPPPPERPKPSGMALGIQAFLEQSQSKGKARGGVARADSAT